MSSAARVACVGLSLLIRLSHEIAETQLGYSPRLLGESLAAQVSDYVRREGLGYYPPLGYFVQTPGLDPDLLALTQEIARYSCEFVDQEIRRQLRGVFSSVRVEQMHCTAYVMPHVRKGQPNALLELCRHYTPDTVKLELIVVMLEKGLMAEEIEQLAGSKALRQLSDGFASVDLLGVRLL